MGGGEAALIRAARNNNQPLPDKVLNAPQLMLGLDLFYDGFRELSTCRSLGMGEGPVPWTAINQYCDRHQLTGEQQDDFEYIIRRMDEAYLEFFHKKRKARETADKNKPRRMQNGTKPQRVR